MKENEQVNFESYNDQKIDRIGEWRDYPTEAVLLIIFHTGGMCE